MRGTIYEIRHVSRTPRRVAWAAACVGAALLVHASWRPADASRAEETATPARAHPPGGPSLPPDIAADPFGVRDWPSLRRTAPVDEPPTPAPAASTPLPFAYVGSWTREGTLHVVLTHNGRSLTVSGARDIDDEFRIDSIDAERIVFYDKRLQSRRTLALTSPPRDREAAGDAAGAPQSMDLIKGALPAGAPPSWLQ